MMNSTIQPEWKPSKPLQQVLDEFLKMRKDNKKIMNKKCQILYIGGNKEDGRE